VLIETGNVRDGLAGVLGRAGELEGLGAVEGRRETDLADLLRVHLRIVSTRFDGWKRIGELTPFKADLAAALACLEPFAGLAEPVKTYASAIAREELAISAAAGA
jgi:hypothetical protein